MIASFAATLGATLAFWFFNSLKVTLRLTEVTLLPSSGAELVMTWVWSLRLRARARICVRMARYCSVMTEPLSWWVTTLAE